MEKPDAGIYFRPNEFWSHSLPVSRVLAQEHQDDQNIPGEDVLPPEQEREGGSRPSSRNISLLTSYSYSFLRSDRVCRLPVDQSLHRLSPHTKRRAQQLRLAPHQEFMRSAIAKSLAPSSSSPTPQARVSNFLERILLGKK